MARDYAPAGAAVEHLCLRCSFYRSDSNGPQSDAVAGPRCGLGSVGMGAIQRDQAVLGLRGMWEWGWQIGGDAAAVWEEEFACLRVSVLATVTIHAVFRRREHSIFLLI